MTDEVYNYLKENKPELLEGIEILTAFPMPAMAPTPLNFLKVYSIIDQIIESTIQDYESQGGAGDWRIHLKPNNDCFEDFCARKAENQLLQTVSNSIPVKHRENHKYQLHSNMDRILMMAKSSVASIEGQKQKFEESEAEEATARPVSITDIINRINNQGFKLRCPFLRHSGKFENIDMQNDLRKQKREDKIPKKLAERLTIPENPEQYPKIHCLAGSKKPYACRVHGLDTETRYIGGDLVSSQLPEQSLVYCPIVKRILEHSEEHLSVFKWLLISGANSITAMLLEKGLREKGYIA